MGDSRVADPFSLPIPLFQGHSLRKVGCKRQRMMKKLAEAEAEAVGLQPPFPPPPGSSPQGGP